MALPAAVSLHSCSDSTSYADLLTSETHATNAYLADHRVVNSVPADSIFEEGEDAPFYRLDEDGMVYMQVINSGDRSDKAASDQLIYFRFTRYNLKTWAQTGELEGEGNADDFDYSSTSFRYGNYTLSSSYQYGSGIQLPLAYLGVECEVNLIIKSQYGFTSEIANVIPYLYHVRYFKSQV
jgi:hypothetical protein